VNGLSYTIEYKTHRSDATWTALPTITGNGTVLSLSDLVAGVPTRFYRIRVD